ncbi:MAG: hypothetical protein OXN16_14855 [Gammaproteobacteria bacterium]|nr:hypothetical protein [Gammaproteobacteria bacterium]
MYSDKKKILRVEVGGIWEPEDFIDTFRGVESFYYKTAIWGSLSNSYRYRYLFFDGYPFYSRFSDSKKNINEELVSEARALITPELRITVDRVEYGSPGSIDIFGAARFLEVLCDAIGKTVKYYSEKDLRREEARQAEIQTQILEASLRNIRQESVDKTLDTIRKIKELDHDHPGWREEFEDDLKLLFSMDLEKVDRVISEGKIVGVEMTDRDPPKDKEAA